MPVLPASEGMQPCSLYGRLEGAKNDHWYGRHRNSPTETWLVCGPCTRQLENPAFRTGTRSCFESFQIALQGFIEGGSQGVLFE